MSQIPQLSLPPAAAQALSGDPRKVALAAKTRASAEEFEQVFLNTMLQQMMGSVGTGAMTGGQAASTWRSFLTDEYAKSFTKAGGIGIADHVQRALMAQQEVR